MNSRTKVDKHRYIEDISLQSDITRVRLKRIDTGKVWLAVYDTTGQRLALMIETMGGSLRVYVEEDEIGVIPTI